MTRWLPLVLLACAGETEVRDRPQGEPPPPICINELMPDNEATLDVGGQTPDWVELHNPTEADVPLDGWSLSESRDPDVILDGYVLPAGGYLVLLADDLMPEADLPFNLDSDGQDLQLIAPDGSGRRVEWLHIRADRSAARRTDCCEGDCWVIADPATPGGPNAGPAPE